MSNCAHLPCTILLILHIRAHISYTYVSTHTPGTPLAEQANPPTPPSALEMTRMIAAARVLMPRSMVRLSAGIYMMLSHIQWCINMYVVCIYHSSYYIHTQYHIIISYTLDMGTCTGRMGFTSAEQALMFLAGANSIFYGDQLLTTSNPEVGIQLGGLYRICMYCIYSIL